MTYFTLLILIFPTVFHFVFRLSILLVVINFVLLLFLLLPIFLVTWADF